jgi:hypothetical protein
VNKFNEQSILLNEVNKSDFVKMQFDQAIETYRTEFTTLIQIVTALIIADLSIVGFAINNHIAGILLIGSLFPLIILSTLIRINKYMLPVVYAAIILENKYGKDSDDWLMSTFISISISPELTETFKRISSVDDYKERMKTLRNMDIPTLGIGRNRTRFSLIIISIGQILIPFLLTHFYNWRLF